MNLEKNITVIQPTYITMQTRSQTKKQSFTIDFDEASRAWTANKKRIRNGCYKYVCCVEKNGKLCNKKCLAGENYCKTHCKATYISVSSNPIHK